MTGQRHASCRARHNAGPAAPSPWRVPLAAALAVELRNACRRRIRAAPPLAQVDLNDRAALHEVVKRERFGAVIHFAALKAVGESVAKPIEYYSNNIGGLLNLLWVMRAEDIRSIVFSSSATVYGSGTPPFREDSATGVGITNPYGAAAA